MTDRTRQVVENRRYRLKTWIDRHFGGVQAAFVEATGINQGELSGLLREKSFGEKKARNLEEKAKMPIGYLDAEDQPGGGAPTAPQTVLVPAYEIEAVEGDENFDPNLEFWVEGYDIEVSAGSGAPVPEYIPTRYRHRYMLNWLQRTGAKAKDLIIMGVKGDSMERTLFDGDKIVIDRGNTRIVSNHVYAIISGGEARVKRLFRSADGRIRIVSDNQDKVTYPDEFVSDDIQGFMVIGRVIDKSGPGGL